MKKRIPTYNKKAKIPTIEDVIDMSFDSLFEYICDRHDDLYDLTIEYKEQSTGKTIRRSWKDREDRLTEKL